MLALFENDLALVRFVEPADLRLLRNGVPWDIWHPWILKAWLRGAVVPKAFTLLRRIPSNMIEKAVDWPASLQTEFFAKLQNTGMLPALPKLDASAISPWMRWDEVRPHFLDFKENGAKEI